MKLNLSDIIKLVAVLLVAVSFSFANMRSTEPEVHVFHSTLTRIDFNEEARSAEIAIQMFTHDVEPTLEKIAKKRIDLSQTKEVEKLLFDYLGERFVIKNSQGVASKLKWIGFEREVDTIFVYVEAEMSGAPDKLTLQNSLFFEHFQEQLNLVVCKFKTKKADLAFKVGDLGKEIVFEEQ